MTQTLQELLETEDPAWPQLRRWLADAPNGANLWTTPRERGEATLYRLQAPASTTLGAMALYTAGVSVDGGWLRLLGAGGPPLGAGLREWNGLAGKPPALPGGLVVAHDAIGGFYVVNAGALQGEPGRVFYRAPRTWVALGVGYTDFVRWCLEADLDRFYLRLRWEGWREEVRALAPDAALIGEGDARRPVPVRALWRLVVPDSAAEA